MKRCSASLISREMQSKTTMRCHLPPVRITVIEKQEIRVLARMWRKGTLVHCRWECKLVQPLWKTVWSFLKKLKNRTIIWSSNSTSCSIVKGNEMKSVSQRDMCTPMFTAALSTVLKISKQPKCPTRNEWIKKKWYIYIYTMESYSALKRRKSYHLLQHGWTWKTLW